MNNLSGVFPLERSAYYQYWLLERAEIEKNKWFLSEKAGKDVGWDYAEWHWIFNHRSGWVTGIKGG
jgi:hypothetical protein